MTFDFSLDLLYCLNGLYILTTTTILLSCRPYLYGARQVKDASVLPIFF